jgi:molecular chaperone HscB
MNIEKELYEPVQNIIENYKEGITTQKELLQVKDYYFKKKYLQRLYQQLNRMS